MSAIQFVYQYWKNEWAKDVDGRVADVPEPYFVMGAEDTEERLRYRDVAQVVDGGTQTFEPADVGYQSEKSITLVNIQLHTISKNRPSYNQAIGSPGRVRMFGYRDKQTLSKERHGGLVGESLRVSKTIRKGVSTCEWDIITTPEVNNISGQYGHGKFSAIITLRMKSTADKIDTSI